APFEVFARTITAARLFPDFIGWAALAVGVNVAFAALVLRLDANFLESAAAGAFGPGLDEHGESIGGAPASADAGTLERRRSADLAAGDERPARFARD